MFQAYRDLPADVKDLRERVRAKFELKSGRRIDTLASKFNWKARRAAYLETLRIAADKGVAKTVAKVAESTATEQAFDYAAWHIKNIERTRRIADQLFDKAEAILKLNVVQSQTKGELAFDADGRQMFDKDGKPLMVNVTILKPSRFSVSDAPKFSEAGLILAQYAREQDRYASTGEIDRDVPAPDKPLEEMSADELDSYIARCREAKDAIIRGEPIDETGRAAA